MEQVLDEIAAPLLSVGPPPVIIVVDGMSAAVAAELGEQLGERGWFEISPETRTSDRGSCDDPVRHSCEPRRAFLRGERLSVTPARSARVSQRSGAAIDGAPCSCTRQT